MEPIKNNEKRIFLLGIIFVITSYFFIQLINNFSIITYVLKEGFTIIKPFFLAFIIAYILYPIVTFIQNKFKVGRLLSVFLTYTILIAFIILTSKFVFPMFISSISSLLKELPNYLNQIQVSLNDLLVKINITTDLDIISTINTAIIDFLPSIKNIISQYASSAVNTTISAFNSIFNMFITMVASFYILLDHESFTSTTNIIIKKLLNEKSYTFLSRICKDLHTNIGKYIFGKFINSLIVSFIAFIGLSIIKSNYTILLSILFGIMNMIPLFGPIIAIAIAVILNIFTGISKCIFILIFLFATQQFESFILEPRTIGKSLNLSGFSTIFAISVFGQLFGIIGMILGIPLMSLIKTYFSKLLTL